MSKFSENLIPVCRKIFSASYPILHQTFSSSYGFPLMQEFHPLYPQLLLYDRKYFCSILIDLSNLSFLFHQKFPSLSYDPKNVFTKQFPNVLQNRCSYIFPDIHKKISFAWRPATLIKIETPTQVFSCEYHKFFYGTPPVVASECGWRISNSSQICTEEFLKEKELFA